MKLLSIVLLSFVFFACGEDTPTAPPQVVENNITISVADATAFEEDGESVLRFQLAASEILTEAITVDFTTVAKTAEAGIDFEQTTGQVTIPVGERNIPIPITILVDDVNEIDETFDLNITTNDSRVTLANTVAEGIISDNDDPVLAADGYSTARSFQGYTLTWEDEFDGAQLDQESYTFEMGDGCPNICGWGNNELQSYTGDPENTSLVDGSLVITARRDGNAFNSSRIITQGKREFQYGRIDIRARLPEGQGIWPAVWMLGANINDVGWPASGEIDIMELVGHEPNKSHGTAHWGEPGNPSTFRGNSITLPEKFSDRFHVFSLVWQENSLDWYVDETKFHSLTPTLAPGTWRFNAPFFFIFNIAVGGNWPGNPDSTTQFPQTMEIDYIRVFQ